MAAKNYLSLFSTKNFNNSSTVFPLSGATNMTCALEDNDGVITGQVPINKVVMQLLGETVAGKTFFVDILT